MIFAAALYYSTHHHIKMYLTISEAGKGIKCRVVFSMTWIDNTQRLAYLNMFICWRNIPYSCNE